MTMNMDTRSTVLVVVRAWDLWSVPMHIEPSRKVKRVCEPLVIDGPGGLWIATGQRNERGQLLYQYGAPCATRA